MQLFAVVPCSFRFKHACPPSLCWEGRLSKSAPIVRMSCGTFLHMEETRLERFLISRGIRPARLEKEAVVSRYRLHLWRMGKSEPRRNNIAKIVAACRALSREP